MKAKKVLLVLLIMFGLACAPVMADNNGCETCSVIAEETGHNYVNVEWIKEHDVSVKRAPSAQLYIDKYYQENYSDVMKTCGLKISTDGCALTSVTMVSNFLKYKNRNPSQVNSILGNSACPLMWYQAATKLGMTVVEYRDKNITTSYLSSIIRTSIAASRPLIIGMKLSNGKSHYVVVTGYTSSGTYNINDPSKYGKTTLNQYISQNATIKQVIVYGE